MSLCSSISCRPSKLPFERHAHSLRDVGMHITQLVADVGGFIGLVSSVCFGFCSVRVEQVGKCSTSKLQPKLFFIGSCCVDVNGLESKASLLPWSPRC